jgi:hypothetical protein
MLLRKLLQIILAAVIFCSPVAIYASEIKELAAEQGEHSRGRQFYDRVLCVDGLKVFQTFSYGSGSGVSSIQLYEEKKGRVVPVRCDGNSFTKK